METKFQTWIHIFPTFFPKNTSVNRLPRLVASEKTAPMSCWFIKKPRRHEGGFISTSKNNCFPFDVLFQCVKTMEKRERGMKKVFVTWMEKISNHRCRKNFFQPSFANNIAFPEDDFWHCNEMDLWLPFFCELAPVWDLVCSKHHTALTNAFPRKKNLPIGECRRLPMVISDGKTADATTSKIFKKTTAGQTPPQFSLIKIKKQEALGGSLPNTEKGCFVKRNPGSVG